MRVQQAGRCLPGLVGDGRGTALGSPAAMSPRPTPGAREPPSQVQGCRPMWALSGTGGLEENVSVGLGPQGCTDTSSGQNPEPWLLLCPWGSTPLFSLLLWTLSTSCHKKRVLSSWLVGSQGGRDGQGDTCSRQGQATPGVEGQACRRDPSSPSSERIFLPVGEAGLAQTSVLTSR